MSIVTTDLRVLPADLSAVNVLAYLGHAFGRCGCSEVDEMLVTLVRLLEWHENKDKPMYDTLFPEKGVFYILAGLLDTLSLAEHGMSIRWPWLTEDGKRLLAALRAHSFDDIVDAEGEAYDGSWYGQSL